MRSKFIQSQANAVVGHARLRKVVRSDPFASITGAHLTSALARDRIGALLLGLVGEVSRASAPSLCRDSYVRSLILTRHHNAARKMRDANSGTRLVDVLPACTRRPIRIDLKVFRINLEINLINFRQDGDGNGGSVNAPLPASVSGTRCTRCAPLSYFNRLKAPLPSMMKTISLKPPNSVSLKSTISVSQLRASA